MLIKGDCWKMNADVIIVGFGAAGAIAAITAHDRGAEVLVVEKQSRNGFYNTTILPRCQEE